MERTGEWLKIKALRSYPSTTKNKINKRKQTSVIELKFSFSFIMQPKLIYVKICHRTLDILYVLNKLNNEQNKKTVHVFARMWNTWNSWGLLVGCKMVKPFWKPIWQFLIKLIIHLPFYSKVLI
jgi:hypothetical protein